MQIILRGLVRRVVVAALLAMSAHAFAGPIGYSVRSDVDRKLYRIDMATGVATDIGVTGFSKIEGLAISTTGEIYGVNPSTAQLVKCSAITGACAAVGTLTGLPQLQIAADGLPDARSRLTYIASKTAAAADKVLNSVDQAKGEHAQIAEQTRKLADALTNDPVKAVASGAVLNFVNDVEARTQRIDSHLTDIMMAQDFHDLTGQVVAKVVALANELEDSLLKLLVQVVPPDQREKVDPNVLAGPVVNPEGRTDVVTNQGEVDDLLASLGF